MHKNSRSHHEKYLLHIKIKHRRREIVIIVIDILVLDQTHS
jgi:hypothetical protein